MKKFVSIILAAVLAISIAGCSSDSSSTAGQSTGGQNNTQAGGSESGKTLNIYCWNDSFKSLFEEYYVPTGRIPEGVTVNWILVPSADNAYQNALDEALFKQADVPDEEKIDMFLVEADYALKYAQSEFTLDVQKDLGLTEDQMSQMYEYTKQIVTTADGAIKAVSPFASPGLFTYRRSIALEVLGTDDPEQVQAYLADWDKFDDVAQQMYDSGYKMLAGYDDSYRVFSNNVSAPWVDGTKIVIDKNINGWIEQTKEYTDKGYNNRRSMWSDGWMSDQGPNGDVFGFFYSTWGVTFTLMENSLATAVADGGEAAPGNGIYGDYGICLGPQSFYWGGTWLCAAAGSDNLAEIKDIMEFFCTEKDNMQKIATDTLDFANNIEAMEEVAASDFKSDFLSGQNPYEYFCKAALNIDMGNVSIYDQGLNDTLGTAMGDYFEGNVDYDTALENFYKAAKEKYPELEK